LIFSVSVEWSHFVFFDGSQKLFVASQSLSDFKTLIEVKNLGRPVLPTFFEQKWPLHVNFLDQIVGMNSVTQSLF
jgi:hypothetical protein